MAFRVKIPFGMVRCSSSLVSPLRRYAGQKNPFFPFLSPATASLFHSSPHQFRYSSHGVGGSGVTPAGYVRQGRRRRKTGRHPPTVLRRSLPTTSPPPSPYMVYHTEKKGESLALGQHGSSTVMLPCSVRDLDHTSLALLGSLEHHVQALEEMLKRHIMHVDGVDYNKACQTFALIEEKNHQYEHYMAAPFQVAIVLCGGGALLSVPLVFSLPVVEFFNEHFVTAEHPQPKELETALEVGSWSWNWMEPVLGTSTFVLLCLQYMRIHLNHLGVQPFTARMKRFRARTLIQAFPQYNADLLTSYSQASTFYNAKDLWF